MNTKGKLKKGTVTSTSTSGIATNVPSVSPTTPYTIFQHSITRARNLLTIHTLAHGSASRPSTFLSDVHRAAIVLAVSALDAYIRTYVVQRMVSNVSDLKQAVPEKMKLTIKEYIGIDSLFEAARQGDLSSRIQKSFQERFEEQSFQGVKKITETMRLIGYDDIFNIISTSASVNEDNLKRDLSIFTKRRHLIAHCGDYDLNQTPPIENRITKKDAEECIKLVSLIAFEINNLR